MRKIDTIHVSLLVSMLLITSVGNAQNYADYPLNEICEQLSIDDEQGDIHRWDDELEEFTGLMNNPVNINTATKEQLEHFPFLSDLQIEHILSYVYIHGPMQTIYELQLVAEMDNKTLRYLLPYVCVKPVNNDVDKLPSFSTILKYGKHEIVSRADIPLYSRKGYEKTYLGPSVYNSLRYGFRYKNNISFGMTAEKDAGEPFFALHDKQGYDYYSLYLLITGIRRLKTLAIGNYRLNFGQGLVLGNGSMFGKTSYLTSFTFRNTGIKKHSSTDEYNYFRGTAATFTFHKWELSTFYSHRKLDGVVRDNEITSIYKTGLHRSEKEVSKMNSFTLQVTGGNLTYTGNRFKVGATGLYYFFNYPFEPELRGYSKYNLHGNYFYNGSIDYKFRFHRLSVQGEAAIGKKGFATVNQLQYSPSQGYQLLLIHRYYGHDYWAMFAHSFCEGGSAQNENGWYLAASAVPFRYWNFFVSADLFSFPWWKYRVSKPSRGMEVSFQADYTPLRKMNMYISWRYKKKERDITGTKGLIILPYYHHRWRYRMNYFPCSSLSLQTTTDYNRFTSPGYIDSQGYRLTQAVGWQPFRLPVKIEIQGSYFHTDDYDSRVYIYEKGLLYSFYTPSFQGEGFRWTAHLRYDLNSHWMIIGKFGQTLYNDRKEIGSGNDLIYGNKKADIQLQLRIKF